MALDPSKFQPMIKNVARSVSSQFPPYVTLEDTEQTLYLWLYDKRTSVLKTVEDSPETWEAEIASTMRKVAFDHCAKEKAATEGYSPDDVYRYSLPKIKALLPDVFDYQDWQSFGSKGDGQPTGRPQANQTGDRTVELIDMRAAIGRLNEDTKVLLFLQYSQNYTMENIADTIGIEYETTKKRAQRALKAIQKELGYKTSENTRRAGDRRTVRSNAASRASLANQYEGS